MSDEVEGLDEEFVYHLDRGAELLRRGDVEAARDALENALGLRPRDAKVLALLGQAFYKQGRFEQAAVAWQRLVDDNPVEAGARVNLGLACLKARRYHEAIRQLEIALDLNPDHRKAMGYLGLALIESGSAAQAREWFLKAGSEQMVARCDELLAAQAEAVAAAPAPSPEPVQALAPLLTSPAEPAPAPVAAPPDAPPAPAAWGEAPTLAAYAAGRVVQARADEPFSVSAAGLAVAVRGEVLCRLSGLAAWRGAIDFAGEVKRFRGRATDKPFGEGPDRVHRLSGEGLVVLHGGGRRFTVLDLGGETGYFREAVVFGFEEPIGFENGRVASTAGDLDLVHLRGRGRIVLRTRGEPVAIDVTGRAPVRVPVEALVGWTGGLTPRLAPLLEGMDGGAVELSGEGRVLVDAAAGGGEGA